MVIIIIIITQSQRNNSTNKLSGMIQWQQQKTLRFCKRGNILLTKNLMGWKPILADISYHLLSTCQAPVTITHRSWYLLTSWRMSRMESSWAQSTRVPRSTRSTLGAEAKLSLLGSSIRRHWKAARISPGGELSIFNDCCAISATVIKKF